MNISSLLSRKIPRAHLARLKTLSCLSQDFGLRPYLIGGVVRDLLMRRPLKMDLDVTFTGGDVKPLAEKLAGAWRGGLTIHPQFHTFVLSLPEGGHIDLVTARKESYARPAALPDVEPGTLDDDIHRRDFSVNAVACSLSPESWGEISDPAQGEKDIDSGVIRVLHPASFQDDPTRIFRAARFAGRFRFRLSPTTAELLRQSLARNDVGKLSTDRVRTELEKVLLEERPSGALLLLARWEAAAFLHKELKFSRPVLALIDRFRPGRSLPKESVWVMRLALWLGENGGAEARSILSSLLFPKSIQEKVLELHGLLEAARAGQEPVSLPQSAPAEAAAYFEILCRSERAEPLRKWWREYSRWQRSRPFTDGEGLKALGFSPGPAFKRMLAALARARYDGKVKSKKDEIRFLVDNFRRD